jgi:GT2 family glycosyltransferase/peptidoglycan/xylan/chitin deacetylase (PgdA/CDA1 family)
MSCSIVIATIRRASILTVTLDSLAAQTEKDFEAIVVCDGEDPETHALSKTYLAAYPLRWLFTPKNHGLAFTRNKGAFEAKGDVLLFLDDDTAAAPDLVHQHLRHHQRCRSGEALVVLGALIYIDLSEPRSRTEHLMRIDRVHDEESVAARMLQPGFQSIELDHIYRGFGVNCSISRRVFLGHGGFDPAIRYGQDSELGSRLYDQGAEYIFEPKARAFHRETKDLTKEFVRIFESNGRNDVYRSSKKGQRNAQTRGLIAVQHWSPIRRLKLRLYWSCPGVPKAIGKISRKVTDITGSRLSYQVWRRSQMVASYWQGVRSEGFTLEALRKFVGAPLPVLMFGSINEPFNEVDRQYRLSPRRFLQLMQWLRRLNYKSIGPAEALVAATPARCVALTFEGGYEDFYYEVFPHVNRFALKPVVFLVMDCIGKFSNWEHWRERAPGRLLSIEQIRELHRHGVQFGSQTLTHAHLPNLSKEELHREVFVSKCRLEDLLGAEVLYFAYPDGAVNALVRAAVAQAGYKIGFSSQEGLNLWEDQLCLKTMKVTDCRTIPGLVWNLVRS